jgi:sugar/nucleoside kinase (ribokinase family)
MDENGTITPRLRQRLGELADRQPEIRFLVDSRRRIGLFRNMILKPNLMEAMAEIEPGNGIGEVSAGRLEEAGKALSRGVQQPVFLTLGERGVLVCTADQCQTIPAAPVQGPLDIVGAGDAFFAGLAASLVTGCSVWEAGAIANLAAAVTVEKVGQTGTATPEEIVERFEKAVKTL